MGRSVYVAPDAIGEFYLWLDDYRPTEEDLEEDEERPEDDWGYLWEDLTDDLYSTAMECAPSLWVEDKWRSQEEKVGLSNYLGSLIITCYGEVVAVYWVVKESDYHNYTGLSTHWGTQFMAKLAALFPGRLERMGTFSNGESVYRKVNKT